MTDYDHPLVVIDMQNYFFKRNLAEKNIIKDRIKKICKLCELWIHRGLPIIVVEYNLKPIHNKTQHDVPTCVKIRNTIKGYQNVTRVIKDSDDGSRELMDKFNEMQVRPKEMHVCGINLNACVRDTVWGLFMKSNDIRINLYKHITFNVRCPNDKEEETRNLDFIQSRARVFKASLNIHECPIAS